jgi:hypothetical protein
MRTSVLVVIALAGGCSEHGSSSSCSGQGCCRSSADCEQSFEMCFAPGQDIGCGACMIPSVTCQQDTECTAQGANFICTVAPCTCDASTKSCVAGCAGDAGCGEGLACGPDHRCAPRACSAASPCPTNFDCGTSGGCVRRTCTTDATCDGACVNGSCFATFGFCSAPPA